MNLFIIELIYSISILFLAIIAKYGIPINKWALLYQAMLRCQWAK